MTFKTGSSWKACFDDVNGRYFCEYGGTMSYDLYEITKEQFDRITEGMTEYTTPNTMAKRNGPDTLRERISACASDPFFDSEQKMERGLQLLAL